jgi:hypothetical protein
MRPAGLVAEEAAGSQGEFGRINRFRSQLGQEMICWERRRRPRKTRPHEQVTS